MLDIDPQASATLQRIALNLPSRPAGLRLWVTGDACQGYKVKAHWSASRQADDVVVEQAGLTLLADEFQWSLLKGGTVTLGERDGIAGLLIKVAPASCQCDSGQCGPEKSSSAA